MFDIDDEEREKDDFFETPPPEEQPKQPKQPVLKPDDPTYWEQEESEWEHLKPRKRNRIYIMAGTAAAALIFLWILWLYLFSPIEEQAVQYGYVEKINIEGQLLKTYEGKLLPYREMMDTTRVYREDFDFSVTEDSLATALKLLERKGIPVRLEYNRYKSVLPWRGQTHILVTGVEEADPNKLLPPEFRPEYSGTQRKDSTDMEI